MFCLVKLNFVRTLLEFDVDLKINRKGGGFIRKAAEQNIKSGKIPPTKVKCFIEAFSYVFA